MHLAVREHYSYTVGGNGLHFEEETDHIATDKKDS